MMNELTRIHSFYKYSLDSFVIVVIRAIQVVADRMNPKKEDNPEEPAEAAEKDDDDEKKDDDEPITPRSLKKRVEALTDSVTYEGFNYVRRGLFERHKLLVATMLCFRIMIRKGLVDAGEVTALIKKEVAMEIPH